MPLTCALKADSYIRFSGHLNVVLVRQRPPDVAEGCQPGNDEAQIVVVCLCWHTVEAPIPFIVRMEEDQIHLNAEIAKLPDTLHDYPQQQP